MHIYIYLHPYIHTCMHKLRARLRGPGREFAKEGLVKGGLANYNYDILYTTNNIIYIYYTLYTNIQ